MRSFIIISITVVALVVGLVVYLIRQPDVVGSQVPQHMRPPPSTTRQAGDPNQFIKPGEGAWVRQYDSRGMLVLQFRAARYDPQPDDSVRVERPEAEFFLADGQSIRVLGREGNVTVPNANRDSKDMGNAPPSTPTRGELRGVRIEMLQQSAPAPILTVELDNVAFDNDTFRIYTQAFTAADGTRVAPDEVPVKVRGDDYEFDGKGLTIRWNERDRRLQLMEIAHGERLVIKHPDRLAKLDEKRAAAPPPVKGEAPAAAVTPVAQPVTPSTQPSTPTTKPAQVAESKRQHPVYRMTFERDVRIQQAERQTLTARQMLIDFRPKETGVEMGATPASTRPVQAPPTEAAGPPVAPPSTAPVVAESVKPEEPPITMLWQGKLLLEPLDGATPSDLAPGEAAIHLVGDPVAVQQRDSGFEAAEITYLTGNSNIIATGTEKTPLKMSDQKGAVVHSERMEYAVKRHVATLKGRSALELPLEQKDGKADTLRAAWNESCVLQLSESAGEGAMRIENAQLRGKVTIEHPQLRLRADGLDLEIEPSDKPDDTDVNLKKLVASGRVACALIDPKRAEQTIECDRLELVTARGEDGEPYPQKLIATGNVTTFDGEQRLSADKLTVTLAATASKDAKDADKDPLKQDLALRELLAEGNVRVETNDGAVGTADTLHITMDDRERPHLTLSGSPAKLVDNENVLVGPVIEAAPDENRAWVKGPGSLRFVQKPEDAEKKAAPVDVTWKEGVTLDGAKNIVDVTGEVAVKTTDSDGTENGATAKSIRITLADTPTEAKSAADEPKAAKDSKKPSTDFMKGKTVASVELREGVEVKSLLTRQEDGALLRRLNLFAETLRYEMDQKRLVIPGAGKMLIEDHREKKTAAPDADAAAQIASSRGATAFEWREGLTYDESKREATMAGGVTIVHKPDDPNAQPLRMEADRVVAEFAAADAAKSDQKQERRVELRRLRAEGNLHFAARGATFDAQSVEFDPTTKILTARGSDNVPAQLFGNDGTTKGSFRELRYNTETDEIQMDAVRAVGRQ